MKGFTQIETWVIHMKRLSFEAIRIYGLIGYLQQHDGLATPTVTAIVPHCPDGRAAILSARQKLRSVGVISEHQPQSAIAGGEA